MREAVSLSYGAALDQHVIDLVAGDIQIRSAKADVDASFPPSHVWQLIGGPGVADGHCRS